MKTIIAVGGIIVLSVGFVVGGTGMVTAQQDATTDESTTETTTDTTNERSARDARIEQYRANVAERLTTAQSARIVARCAAAQTRVTTLQSRVLEVISNRQTIYTSISTKLDEAVTSLQTAGIDATELSTLADQFDTDSLAVLDAISEYQQTLGDIAAMDCAADPEGFQAALTSAREQRAEAVVLATSLKTFVTDSIKPVIAELRQQLADTAADDEATTETTDGGAQ